MAQARSEKDLFQTLFHLTLRHWKMGAIFVTSAIAVTVMLHFSFPVYQATSSLYVKSAQTSPILSAISKMSGYQVFEDSQKPINAAYLEILNSDQLQTFIENRFAVSPNLTALLSPQFHAEFGTEHESAKLVERLIGATRFGSNADQIIVISTNAHSPEAAADAANLMNSLAVDYLNTYAEKELSDIESFLEDQLHSTQKKIDELDAGLARYKGDYSIVDVSRGDVSSFTQKAVDQLKGELETIDVQVQENESLISSIEKEFGIGSDGNAQNLENSQLRGGIVDRYRMLKDQRNELHIRQAALRKRLDKVTANLKPQYQERVFEFTRKLQIEHDLFRGLTEQLASLRVFRISIGQRILRYAATDAGQTTRQTPLGRKIVMAVALSFALLVLLTYLWDQVQPVATDRRDLEAYGMKYLGSIPNAQQRATLMKGLLSPAASSTITANRAGLAFQFLRTRLYSILRRSAENTKVVSVISSGSGDGKSFITVNLAILFGRYNLNVLIVDCDALKPSEGRMFANDNPLGLTDVLKGEATLEQALNDSNHRNVTFMGSGQPTANFDHLVESKFKELIASVKDRFDVILLDTPAATAGPEASIIANCSDHILFVANTYKTHLRDIETVLESLDYSVLDEIYLVMNRHENMFAGTAGSYYHVTHSHWNKDAEKRDKNVAA